MMRRCIILAGLIVASTAGTFAQTPSAVHAFVPGGGQSSGQEPAYFPANVLGLPDATARRSVPAIDPREIASLGMGGEIVLRFDTPIVDGDGVDFTVFENAFYYTIGPRERLYAEPAQVSVSRDGERFVAFPFDSLTLVGCAGTAPTHGDQNPYDPRVSGGNGFDLAMVGLDSVRFVRIRDVTAFVAADPSHPSWDPTLSGFDLDAVVAIPLDGRTAASAPTGADARGTLHLHPNPARERVLIEHTHDASALHVRDLAGRTVLEARPYDGARATALSLEGFAAGFYFVEVIDASGGRSVTMLRVVR